jgi:hypothetical protein
MPSAELTAGPGPRDGAVLPSVGISPSMTTTGFPGRADWTRDLELLFLVGSPRSGTTWLQSLIASHPEIHTGPETQFFGAYEPVEKEFLRVKDGRCGISEYLCRDAFYDLMAENFWRVISALPEPACRPRLFLEKSPYHCVFAPLILRVFPRARFLHLIRDARTVVASMLRISKSWGESWAPDTAERATKFWFECVSAGCQISELVPDPSQYLGIRYEDVRSDPAGYLGGIYDWASTGLPMNSRQRSRRTHSTARGPARTRSPPSSCRIRTTLSPSTRTGSSALRLPPPGKPS